MVPFRSEEAVDLRNAARSKPYSSANLIFLFTTPFPFCPFREVWLFLQHKSPFPSYPSVSVPFGTGWFSRCTVWSILTYPPFPKGF